jgi:molybdenum cofactor biosynthesis protein B
MRLDDLPESGNIEDRRGETGGGGGGFGLPIGGGGLGIGTVVVLGLIGWAFGIDPSLLIGGAEIVSGSGQHQTKTPPSARRTTKPQDETGRFVDRVLGSTEARWKDIFAQDGKTYRPPVLVLYRGATDAKCGRMAQSAMGPFYCPEDRKVYLDTSFFNDIARRFRGCEIGSKSCEFAQAYVIAHEVGHHVQNLLGILPKAQHAQRVASTKAEANHIQVQVELQADCLAGVRMNISRARASPRSSSRAMSRRPCARPPPSVTTPCSGARKVMSFPTASLMAVPSSASAGSTWAFARVRCKAAIPSPPRSCDGMPGIDPGREFIPLKIAVLTVSDTRAMADDKSGATLVERIGAAGHELAERAIVADVVEQIRARVKTWIADPAIDVIITTGGTGFTGRDVTPEALEPLFEKRMEAFSMLFLMVSHGKIGTSAIQTRATAGVAGATYIFCLPGSPGACKDAWDAILVHQLDYRYRPCNFVEIMPRLDEHLRRPEAKGATV